MIRIEFAVDFSVRQGPDGVDRDEIAAQCNALMDELVKLGDADCGIYDPAISLDLDVNIVTIEVVAEGFDVDAAIATAASCVRTAIHGARGATPDWGLAKRGQRAELLTM